MTEQRGMLVLIGLQVVVVALLVVLLLQRGEWAEKPIERRQIYEELCTSATPVCGSKKWCGPWLRLSHTGVSGAR